MKYFIVSDVHSYFDILIKTLNDSGFDINNTEHIFISLGDLLDRGKQPKECLQFVISIPKNRRILIKGNHESLLQELIKNKCIRNHDIYNGTADTMFILTNKNINDYYKNSSLLSQLLCKNDLLNKYFDSLVNYSIINNNIFVHGWIPENFSIESPQNNYNWEEAMWTNGMSAWQLGLLIKNYTIYCGHYHTSWGHSRIHNNGSEFGSDAIFTPFIDKGICAIDACTAYTKKMNCVVLEIN